MSPDIAEPIDVESGADAPGREPAVDGKRILIVINSDENGGVEHLAEVLGGDLIRMGGRVETVFLYPRGATTAGVKIGGIIKAAREICRRRPDVIMAFQATSSSLAGLMGKLCGVKASIIHQSNMPGDTNAVARALDRIAGTIGLYTCNIANSGATVAAFASYPARYRRVMRRIDHGVSWTPPRRTRAEMLEHIGVPGDGPLLLGCSRLVQQKALSTVIEAMPMIPGARLVIAGQGPKRDYLLDLARALGVEERVHLIGNRTRPEIDDLYGACDLFVFPSRWETFGLAAVEAAMHGRPVVASNLDVSREVLEANGQHVATFVPEWTGKAWADAINAVLADTSARSRAEAHAVLMRQKYSQCGMLNKYRALYREVLA